MLAYCKHNGIGVIPWAPLAGGDLARPLAAADAPTARAALAKGTPWEQRLSAADTAIVGRVEELAKKKGWSMSQVALVWAASKVTAPIVGVSSVERLEQAITAGLELDEEEIKYLEEP